MDALADWRSRTSHLRRVALDTNAVIYYLGAVEPYFERMTELFSRAEAGELSLVLPVIVEAELVVGPLRSGDEAAVETIRTFLESFPNLSIVPIDRSAAQRASGLRARHGLGMADALLAAVAIEAGCDAIVGNDHRCAQRLTEIEYVLLGVGT